MLNNKIQIVKDSPSTVFCTNDEDLFGLDVVFGMCVNNALKKLYNYNKKKKFVL